MILAFKESFAITNPFGAYDPIAYANYGGKHPGVDFNCPIGTPLYAGMNGYLSRKLWGATLRKGNEAIITNGAYQRRYGHMQEITRPDGWVNEGELIGYSGNTGYSSGPHLHDELLIDGVYVDVTKHLGGTDMPNDGDVDNVYLEFNGRKATDEEKRVYTGKDWSAGDGLYYGKVVPEVSNLKGQLQAALDSEFVPLGQLYVKKNK